MSTIDPWIAEAASRIKNDYGDDVNTTTTKALLKFGSNELIGTTKATIMRQPAGILEETYVSTNIIDTISSSSTSDTASVTIEGHTISGTNLTFSIQTATLNGRNKVVLSTPLARVTRVYNNSATDLVGNIYVYEDDTISAGVPNTDTKVHLIVEDGFNNSEKASTSVSSTQYWVVTGFYGDTLEKSASFASIELEVRESGKTFITKVGISANTGGRGSHEFKPYLIVKPNSDIRLSASAGGANTHVSGGIQGTLLTVI